MATSTVLVVALRVMLIEPAPIMVCDIKMPGRDGIWLVERVHEKWPQTAIIMATAVDDLQTVMKSQRAGAICIRDQASRLRTFAAGAESRTTDCGS